MKRTTRRWPRLLGLAVPFAAAVTLGLSLDAEASPRDAAGVVGRLTLPFAARWGEALLPAGDYSFTIDSLGGRHFLLIQGSAGALVAPGFLTAGPEAPDVPEESALIAVRQRGSYTVRALRLSAEGLWLTLSFPLPAAASNRARSAPALLQRVPVQLREP